jgi:4-carboxymuconolactone decarboxylase
VARIDFPDPDTMTPEQRAVYEKIVSGPRGKLVGPLRAALLIPELADAWQQFGARLRYGTTLPKKITELAILCVGRYYNSQVEWFIHAKEAQNAGLEQRIVDAIHDGHVPAFEDAEERIAYEFARQLLMHGNVDDELHDATKERWGQAGVVELTAVIGYYTMVSMTLNAQAIPTPDGSSPLAFPSDEKGRPKLSALPEA